MPMIKIILQSLNFEFVILQIFDSFGGRFRASHSSEIRNPKVERAAAQMIGIGVRVRVPWRVNDHRHFSGSDFVADVGTALLDFVDDLSGNFLLFKKRRCTASCDDSKPDAL